MTMKVQSPDKLTMARWIVFVTENLTALPAPSFGAVQTLMKRRKPELQRTYAKAMAVWYQEQSEA